jgi:hypothetical protein
MATAGAKPVKLGANTSGDTRAVYHSGNVQPNGGGHNDVGCTTGQSDITSSLNYTIDSSGTYITINPPYPTAPFSVFVKGGPAYNVYSYPPNTLDAAGLTNLHSPVNNGGNIAAISHWFVCGGGTPPPPTKLNVYTGYADTYTCANHAALGTTLLSFFGGVWEGGGASVNFVGSSTSGCGYDAAAVRINNPTGSAISGVVVTVDVGGTIYAPWGAGPFTIPANGDLVLTQSVDSNFDISEYAQLVTGDPCGTTTTKPVVHITIGAGATQDVTDTAQKLIIGGFDPLQCHPDQPFNESLTWGAAAGTVSL